MSAKEQATLNLILCAALIALVACMCLAGCTARADTLSPSPSAKSGPQGADNGSWNIGSIIVQGGAWSTALVVVAHLYFTRRKDRRKLRELGAR